LNASNFPDQSGYSSLMVHKSRVSTFRGFSLLKPVMFEILSKISNTGLKKVKNLLRMLHMITIKNILIETNSGEGTD
jgi:hypothetical protein